MLKSLLICVSLFASTCPTALAQTWQWAKTATGDVDLNNVYVLPNGQSYVTGLYKGQVTIQNQTLNSTAPSALLAKFGADGNLLFARTVAATTGISVAADYLGNVYVVGPLFDSIQFDNVMLYSEGSLDMYVAAYGSEGQFKWVRRIGGPNTDGFYNSGNATIPNVGGVVVSGTVYGDFTIDTQHYSATGNSAVVTRLDENGQVVWVQVGIASGGANGLGVSADEQGNVYSTGGVYGTAQFGNVVVPGSGSRPFVVKFRLDGTAVWASAPNSTVTGNQAMGFRTVPDNRGNVFFCGHHFNGFQYDNFTIPKSDYFLAKLDSTGACTWLKSGKAGYFGASSLAVDKTGDVYMAGHFLDSVTANGLPLLSLANSASALYIVKFKNDGTPVWAKGTDAASGIGSRIRVGLDYAGNLYAAGTFEGTLKFGNEELSAPANANTSGMYLARLSQNLGVAEVRAGGNSGIRIYPVPAGNELVVSTNDGKKIDRLLVYDALGKTVVAANGINSSSTTVNLTKLTAGTYYVQVNGSATQRFQIAR